MYLHHGDSRIVLRDYPDNHFDSICTDPPYALTSISKRYGKVNNRQVAEHGVFNRVSRGFMGKQWDNGSVAFDPAFWQECLRVLKPGGHLLAMGGTRTHHRLWTAIEDAGFEIRESLAWLHAQGFPKSRNVSKEMDKAARAEREVVGDNGIKSSTGRHDGDEAYRLKRIHSVTAPATDLAKQWDGWGTALKPAMELICLARKPLSEKSVAANVARWGTGAINIDGCRVPTGDKLGGGGGYSPNAVYSQPGWVRPWMSDPASQQNHMAVVRDNIVRAETLGRWPANLLHDGSPEVLLTFPNTKTGNLNSVAGSGEGYGFKGRDNIGHIGSEGSAARFFASFPPDVICALCLLPSDDVSGRITRCTNAYSATTQSSSRNRDTAPTDVQASLKPEPEDNSKSNHSIVSIAEDNTTIMPAIIHSIVDGNAKKTLSDEIVRDVQSAGKLCVSCATAIARSLVATLPGQSPAIHLGPVSISEPRRLILSHNLALYVAGRENTATILTIPNLKMLFGSVQHAITEDIPSERNDPSSEFAATRLRYQSKASVKEREFGLDAEAPLPLANTNGDERPSYADYQGKRPGARANNHPTCKPLALMRYLIKLVTPPGGIVLDPFMGSGSTGVAAAEEGFNFVGVEQDASYFAISEKRIAAARRTTPPCDEAVSSITTRTVPLDDGEGGSSFPQAMPR